MHLLFSYNCHWCWPAGKLHQAHVQENWCRNEDCSKQKIWSQERVNKPTQTSFCLLGGGSKTCLYLPYLDLPSCLEKRHSFGWRWTKNLVFSFALWKSELVMELWFMKIPPIWIAKPLHILEFLLGWFQNRMALAPRHVLDRRVVQTKTTKLGVTCAIYAWNHCN